MPSPCCAHHTSYQFITSNLKLVAVTLMCIVVRLPVAMPSAPWSCILYSSKCDHSKKLSYLVTCTGMMGMRNISVKMYSGAQSTSIWNAQGEGAKVSKQWFIAIKSFNCLILACEAIINPMKCTSQIYRQWKSDLDTSWKCFMHENSELSCWNFIMGVNWVFSLPKISHWEIIVFGCNKSLFWQ